MRARALSDSQGKSLDVLGVKIPEKKKVNLQNCGLCCPGWPQNKTEGKWKRMISTWTLLGNWKIMEHEGNSYTNRDWRFWYSHQRIIEGTNGLRNRRTNGDHLNYNMIENGQNTEKSPGDLRRLAVTQTSVKNHQVKLIWERIVSTIMGVPLIWAFSDYYI